MTARQLAGGREVADHLYPPVEPMLAAPVSELPIGPDWVYEPKWDGSPDTL